MITHRKIKSKKVFLASDHAGFKLKEEIKKFLIKKRNKVLDLGTKNITQSTTQTTHIYYQKK